MKRRNWAVIPAMPADALAAANCTVRGARARSDLEHPTLRPLVRHAGAVMSTNRQLDSPGEQAYGAGAGHEERAFGLRLAATMVTSRNSRGSVPQKDSVWKSEPLERDLSHERSQNEH
jgi:hypothetical protein